MKKIIQKIPGGYIPFIGIVVAAVLTLILKAII